VELTRRELMTVAAAATLGLSGAGCLGAGSSAPSADGSEGLLRAPVLRRPRRGPRLYVFPDGELAVYAIGGRFSLIEHGPLAATAAGTRGCCASAADGAFFVSYGGDGRTGSGSMLRYDLASGRVVWSRTYPEGIDSMAITPDGSTIYLPSGEAADAASSWWAVVEAASGAVRGRIPYGIGPHNTVVGLGGQNVYLGARHSNRLGVASTRTNRVVRTIGPLISDVRPFTVNRDESLAFTTATGFLGFQVSDLRRGVVLYTVDLTRLGFAYDSAAPGPSCPSHGISLAPSEDELYVIDTPNRFAHAFDVTRLPGAAPRLVASVRLSSMSGKEAPCAYDCRRDGWLCHSRDGLHVFVGDSGDVIDTGRRRVAVTLPVLANTRKFLEIDYSHGKPVFAATTRAGLGYV
jgi:DNA-binding beta-propeller fold protein YncE